MAFFRSLSVAMDRKGHKQDRPINCRAPLKTHRAASGEKIFRQSKQKSARIVDPMRRIFVTISERSSGGKDSADSLCEGFLEVPLNKIEKQ